MVFIAPSITIMINNSSKRSSASGLLRWRTRDRRRSRSRSRGRWFQCFAVLFLLAQICVAPIAARAQQTPAPSASDLAPLKQLLDQIQQAIGHGGHTDQREKLAPIRDGLRDRFDVLDPRLAEVDSRLSQLGPAPAAGAPPETPTIAAERAQLSQTRAEVDAALKETRLLSVQADNVAANINETRRALFSRALFQRTPGALDRGFWRETARALQAEAQSLNFMLGSWMDYARRHGGAWGATVSVVTLALFAGLAFAAVYGWRHRFVREAAPDRTARRFARALAALLTLVRHAVLVPVCVLVTFKVLDGNGLLLPIVSDLGLGLAVAVAVASFGHAVAVAVLAPGAPHRRLVNADDLQARRLASYLTWGARFLGAAIFLNIVHKSVGAPLSATVATSALLAVLIGLLTLYLLIRLPPAETSAGLRWLRFLAWVFVAAIAAALVTGFIGFAAFLAGRAIVLLMMLGAYHLGASLIDAVASDLLNAESERGRRVAAMFGLSPRGLELVAILLAVVLKVCLALLAIFPVLGPWGVFAADFFDVIQDAVFGFRVGNVSISVGTIISVLLLVLIGFVATRAIQRWLDRRFLPRTGLDPGLQNSVSVLFGYAGVITVLIFALAELGIDLQKIALIAGALSVGIGFGLQSVVSNFVCGIILLAERPIRVGDWVLVKNEEGFVRRISVRATEIETFDRASVIIPNQDFITGVVKNMTHGNPIGRIIVKLGVGYDSDMDRVREMLLEIARAHPQVLRAPAPSVFFIGFGVLALDVELRCFVANVEQALTTRSDLNFTILRRFREARIGIPTNPADLKLAAKTQQPG
jgi:potassium-dependent mechanosensitive channel